MLHGPGPDLDRLVALRLGESAPQADYSIDPTAADRLIVRLEAAGLLFQWEQADELWYCAVAGKPGQRLATGSGSTRELALCRALSNLPANGAPDFADPCRPQAERKVRKRAALPEDRGAAPTVTEQAAGGGACADCGGPLPRVRALSPFCPVCSYRRGRQARIDFEARRRNRRRRSPVAG